MFAALFATAMMGLLQQGIAGDEKEREPAAQPAAKPKGSFVIVGGGKVSPAIADRFWELAGNQKSRTVIIPTASASADSPIWKRSAYLDVCLGGLSLDRFHTRDPNQANDQDFVNVLRGATGVWLGGGDQEKLMEAYANTLVHKLLKEVYERGGVIGGTSAGAAVMSKVMIAEGDTVAKVGEGFGFLPEQVVIDQHFTERGRLVRLLGLLKEHPGLVGLGIDENTALVITGIEEIRTEKADAIKTLLAGNIQRWVITGEVVGTGNVSFCDPHAAQMVRQFKPGEKVRLEIRAAPPAQTVTAP